MTAFLFITDLDNTLVGDDAALKELNQQLEQHRQDYGTKIVYATGRSPALYRKLTSEKSLLSPDALITSVGTEICFNPQEEIVDPEWADMLAQGWNRDAVVAIAAHYSDLVLQPETEQRPFKVSYVLSEEISSEVLPRLESSLKEKGLDVKLIYSGGQDLDILPRQGDKGLAVQFLRKNGTWTLQKRLSVAILVMILPCLVLGKNGVFWWEMLNLNCVNGMRRTKKIITISLRHIMQMVY